MTSAAFVQNDAEPETTGAQPDAPFAPRVQQVADVLAEARTRRLRESGTNAEPTS